MHWYWNSEQTCNHSGSRDYFFALYDKIEPKIKQVFRYQENMWNALRTQMIGNSVKDDLHSVAILDNAINTASILMAHISSEWSSFECLEVFWQRAWISLWNSFWNAIQKLSPKSYYPILPILANMKTNTKMSCIVH